MINAQEMRNMTIADLQKELISLRKKQFSNRLKKASGSLDKPHHIKQIRRSIARIKTIMTEKGGLDS